jgi:hypothetical protein
MRRRTTLATVLILPAVAASEDTGQPAIPQADKELDAGLADLRDSGGSAPMRALTSFDRDTACCYRNQRQCSGVHGGGEAAVRFPPSGGSLLTFDVPADDFQRRAADGSSSIRVRRRSTSRET